MSNALFWHRLQFGFTATYHYLVPQLTMGLALLIVLLKLRALRRGDESADQAARFWARILGINFAVGVVTGIPLEFQFGTNWARFSAYSGAVIGQTLAMEGVFAFFLESSFLGLFLYGEKRLGPKGHFASAVALWLGSWISGYFIVQTNAFMQHPVGQAVGPDGVLELRDFFAFVFNPWGLWQYAHTISAAVVTGAFAMAAVGAAWLLLGRHREVASHSLRLGVIVGALACVLQIFPTGDQHGKMVAEHQPVTLAAMEGLFESGPRAELAILGQPDVARRRLENPLVLPGALSFLAYGSFGTTVTGLNDFPIEQWPDNVELLYYSYHIMVGLGTAFLAISAVSLFLLWRKRLETSRWMLWVILLAAPFPYIANTAGWMTAEFGRQPWLVYGLQRTAQGDSPLVSAGDVAFTTLGFAGLYLVVGLLWVYLIGKTLAAGPGDPHSHADPAAPAAAPRPREA